ncbi:MAG: hypothetical protein QOJ96_453 [Alphaproteobacteria bacterium]|jgi:hypothetical protein|nr:hypothetical protein [Alphaproteobacteria bacterium]
MVSVLPQNHAREISFSLHPSTEVRFAAPRDPRAGLGAFLLHRHRTMDERPPVQSRSGVTMPPETLRSGS